LKREDRTSLDLSVRSKSAKLAAKKLVRAWNRTHARTNHRHNLDRGRGNRLTQDGLVWFVRAWGSILIHSHFADVSRTDKAYNLIFYKSLLKWIFTFLQKSSQPFPSFRN